MTSRQWPRPSTADRARRSGGRRRPRPSTPCSDPFRLALRRPVESAKRTAMRSSNTPKIIFLQKFYEQLGIRCFGSKWDGSEISSTEMVLLEEGLEIRSKLNEALVELQTHYTDAKVDEVFVKDLIAIDQETGVLQTEYIDDLENNTPG